MFENKITPYRGNSAIKGPNATEYVDKETFEFRAREIVKCKKSIHYFAEHYYTIVNLDRGKEIIKLFPKQVGLLDFFVHNKRCVVLSARQSSKTTSYSIYCIWYTIFNNDKKVLIAADKESTAIDILSRMRLAYEYLPMWIKPGILTYNKGSIEFSNGSKIEGVATTENSGIGKSCNCIDGNSMITIADKRGILYDISIEHAHKFIKLNEYKDL